MTGTGSPWTRTGPGLCRPRPTPNIWPGSWRRSASPSVRSPPATTSGASWTGCGSTWTTPVGVPGTRPRPRSERPTSRSAPRPPGSCRRETGSTTPPNRGSRPGCDSMAPVPKVLLLTAQSLPHDDEETPLLAAALGVLGVDAEIVPWTAPELSRTPADLTVIRTTWDYTERLTEFL